MKKRTAIGAALGLAAFAGAGVAWAADQTINVTAQVAGFCEVTTVTGVTVSLNIGTPTIGASSSTIPIALASDSVGIMQDWGFRFVAEGTCNAPSFIQLTSARAGLRENAAQGAPTGTFLRRLDYSAQGSFAGSLSTSLSTNSVVSGPVASTARNIGSPSSGQITVDVAAIINSSAPLLAGEYSDVLTVTIAPQ